MKSVISLYAGKSGEKYNTTHLSEARMPMMNAAKKVLYPLERKVILNRVIRARWPAKKVAKFLKMDIRAVNRHEKNALVKLMDYANIKKYEADMQKMGEFREEMQKLNGERRERGYYVENFGPSYPLNELGNEANKYLEDRLKIYEERLHSHIKVNGYFNPRSFSFANDILEIIRETFVVRDYHRRATSKAETSE